MTTDPKHLTEAQAATEAARLIREAYRQEADVPPAPTYFRDTSPVPTVGTTPPVPQPDSRIVPQWAAGVAVASIGVGAGATGLGCCAYLVLKGLASVTLTGVLAITAPFAGAAMLATAIGVAVSKARSASTTNIYKGQVVQRTEITSTARGFLTSSKAGR
ncbi:hypothetical protein PV443_43965 [Streptomyces scabiei]|uniref:hypothetical protein n=1 Tax=Streptomyces scabiei TaxID=1930 RepID=UPI0029BE9E40|nr:hypothetical protein [Streptomyces scabiei]MDX2872017.1 hypothetical protein [Streptomyces scabiei]